MQQALTGQITSAEMMQQLEGLFPSKGRRSLAGFLCQICSRPDAARTVLMNAITVQEVFHVRQHAQFRPQHGKAKAAERPAPALSAACALSDRHAGHRLLPDGSGGSHQFLRPGAVEAQRHEIRRLRQLHQAPSRSGLLDGLVEHDHLDRADRAAADAARPRDRAASPARIPWRGLARALIIIPWALPSVVIALMWRWIYDPTTGVLNDILLYLSIVHSAVPWLADPHYALYSIIATLTWQGFPFFAVMILAGLQGIPRSQYEAASIDGASSMAAVPAYHPAGHCAGAGNGRVAAGHLGGELNRTKSRRRNSSPLGNKRRH